MGCVIIFDGPPHYIFGTDLGTFLWNLQGGQQFYFEFMLCSVSFFKLTNVKSKRQIVLMTHHKLFAGPSFCGFN